MSSIRMRLDLFDPKIGLDRGVSRVKEMLWYFCKIVFFLSALPWPTRCRTWLLRRFGAQVGQGVVIKPRTNIHFPWKLFVGDHTWIGEEVFILNLESVWIGSHACISQRSFLCTGNHDYHDPTFRYRNAPIVVETGAWIGAQSFVGPGVTVGRETVIQAGSIVTRNQAAGMICGGNPCRAIRQRRPE